MGRQIPSLPTAMSGAMLQRALKVYDLFAIKNLSRKQIVYKTGIGYETVKRMIRTFERRRFPRPAAKEIVSPYFL